MARLIRIATWAQEAPPPDFSGMAGAIAAPPVVELAEREAIATAADGALDNGGQTPGREPLALRRVDARARAEERRRISRLLHDEVGQSLTALTVKLAVLRGHSSRAIQNELRDVHKLLEKTLSQVQALSKDLHPSAVEDLGLIPALRSHIQRFSQDAVMAVRLEALDPGLSDIDSGLALAVFRAVEALLADLRDASTAKATLTLTIEQGTLQLEVRAQMRKPANGRGRPSRDLVPDVQNFHEQVLIAGGAVQCKACRNQAIITAQFPMAKHGKV
jgi:signal transduction histidine kinase